MDVVIVGAAGRALLRDRAARLAKQDQEPGRHTRLNIAVLEKAGAWASTAFGRGGQPPRVPELSTEDLPFRQPVSAESVYLLTERRAQRIPTPPTMHNKGYYTASLCEIVRWLGERAERAWDQPVCRLPGGWPAGGRQRGSRSAHRRLRGSIGRANPTGSYTEPTDLTARLTVVAEGTRGLLSQAYRQWQKIGSSNPQLFALGVKEVWQTQSAARPGGPHPGMAATHRRVRRQFHVSAGPGRKWPSAWWWASTITTPLSMCMSCFSG